MQDALLLLELDTMTCRQTARRLRGEAIYCRIQAADEALDSEMLADCRGLVLCGAQTGEPAEIPGLEGLLSAGLPVLALGDTALTVCVAMGGGLGAKLTEPGVQRVQFAAGDPVTGELDISERWLPVCRFMQPGSGAVPLGQTEGGVLAIRGAQLPVYGFAFEVEQNDPDGMRILCNFAEAVCGCTPWWSTDAFVLRATEEISQFADGGDAVCAVSGGVDSAVCAMLAKRAIGSRLHCIFVDTGLLRPGEAEWVTSIFRSLGIEVNCIDARDEFVEALKGQRDQREKEKLVFARLRAILRREVSRLPEVRIVLQGTNYSDSLERELPFPVEFGSVRVRIMEPVRDLFKDEIRRVAETIGLPEEIAQRQPFPGSGLALRVYGEVTEEKLAILRQADAIYREEIERAGQQKKLWQYYALLADNPVPEQDDVLIVLRAVQVAMGGVAAARLPSDLLERCADRITKEVPRVRRVLYDLTRSRTLAKSLL